MSFKPWYKRFPNRLKEEADAYEAAHLGFRLNETLLNEHGTVVFEGTVVAGSREQPLQVVYPAGFPLVRPEVVAAAAALGRHQNPYEANLCLLANDQGAWRETDSGAFMVRQAIALLDANQAGAASVADQEVDAPEPYSTWYPYSPGAAFILLEQPPSTQTGEFGTFRFIAPASGRPVPQAVLTEMSFVSNAKGAAPRANWKLPDRVIPIQNGAVLAGSWLRCDEPPPFLKADGGRAGYKEYLGWAKGREKKLSYRMADLSKSQNGLQAFALVYPDEGPKRGQYYDNWLVGIEGGGLAQPVLLRPFLWTQEDQIQRQPSLSGLKDKKVLVVGLGALGASLAAHLARAGVGQLGLVDHDFVDAGPLVRQDYDLHDIGLSKTEAVAMRVRRINPRIDVEMFPVLLGAADVNVASLTQPTDLLVQFAEAIKDYDLLISTTGTTSVDSILNEMAASASLPCLFTWVLNGAWGGRVFRALPNQACYECLRHSWKQFAQPQEDPSDASLYVRGCGFPTFTGTGFDAAAVAGISARLVVQTLLAGHSSSYPDSLFNLINWSSRGPSLGMFPQIEQFNVVRQDQCRICQMYNL